MVSFVRARPGWLAGSLLVHAAILALGSALPARRTTAPPAAEPEAIEVRIFAPRLAAPARPPAGSGRAGIRGRAARGRSERPARPPTGSGHAGLRPEPPGALLRGPRPATGGGGGAAGVAFAGASAGGFTPPLETGASPGRMDVSAEASDWLRRNQRAIERRIQFAMNTLPYPRDARRRGWKGTVIVSFRLAPDGRAHSIRVVRSSGYDVLDRCAVEAVEITPRFPRPPIEHDVEIEFAFRLMPG